jgi:hypothetical protein
MRRNLMPGGIGGSCGPQCGGRGAMDGPGSCEGPPCNSAPKARPEDKIHAVRMVAMITDVLFIIDSPFTNIDSSSYVSYKCEDLKEKPCDYCGKIYYT